jgi:hypothetical protein
MLDHVPSRFDTTRASSGEDRGKVIRKLGSEHFLTTNMRRAKKQRRRNFRLGIAPALLWLAARL